MPYTFAANTNYSVKFRVEGSGLSAKIWTGPTEPGWTITGTDTTFSSGGTAALSFDVWDSTSRTAYWDNYTVTDLAPGGGGGSGAAGSVFFDYDLLGNRTKVTDQLGGVVEYTYDDRSGPAARNNTSARSP